MRARSRGAGARGGHVEIGATRPDRAGAPDVIDGSAASSTPPIAAGIRDVQYLVLPDAGNPYLLARVRWPDVCQAISPVHPSWQDDPGLFDLPYDPTSTPVTPDQAAAIAAEWDARLPTDATAATASVSFMRRMPADWSNLSRAEQRTWSIDTLTATEPTASLRTRLGRWRRRREVRPSFRGIELAAAALGAEDVVIDLTQSADDAPATVDGA